MAAFNEILSGRYNRFLQKLLQIKGGPPAAQLASEVGAQITLYHGSETMYLQGWELFGGGYDVGPQVGVASAVRLRNPGNSGVVGVVTKAWASSTLASKILLSIGVISADYIVGTTTGWDTRGRPFSTLVLSQNTGIPAVGFGVNAGNYFPAAGIVQEILIDELEEFPILPGSCFQIATNVQNTELVGGIWWRERALEESELK